MRVWAYTRVSTDNQTQSDEGSLRNQEQALTAAVKAMGPDARLVRTIREEGVSGKNMARPALQELLRAVRAGEVDCVIVTAIDRLSRSLLDFFELNKELRSRGVSFRSLKERFDTTTPMGEAMLKIVLVFAELERAQTAERTGQAMRSRAERGLWNGGPPPLGYDPAGEGALTVNPAEVVIVRAAYAQYLELRSTRGVAQWLNDQGYRQKEFVSRRRGKGGGRAFSQPVVSNLLQNRLYLGEVRNRGEWFPGRHESIVDVELFGRVQEVLKENGVGRKRARPAQPKVFPLAGILRCVHCGLALTSASSKGKYRYYRCVSTTKKNMPSCPVGLLSADKVEAAVRVVARDAAANPELVADAVAEAERIFKDEIEPESKRLALLRSAHRKTLAESRELFEWARDSGLGELGQAKSRLFALDEQARNQSDAIAALDGKLAVAETQKLDRDFLAESLRTFDSVFDALSAEDQKDLMQAMFHRIDYHPDGRMDVAVYDGRTARVFCDLKTQNSKRAERKTSQPAAVRGADSGVNPEFVQRIDWLPVRHRTRKGRGG